MPHLRSFLAFLGLLSQFCAAENPSKPDYKFDTTISRPVLENYLARSATVASLLHLTLDDDLRMMKNTGVKFAGRVIWMWGRESQIDDLVANGTPFVKRIHKMDPDIILQGAIFEIVTTDVNKIPIPADIFEEFGLEPEKRNFRYEDMLYPRRHRVDHWEKGASVPDMSRVETRMWFVYVGKRWIDMGVEAIHFGQVALMDDRDRKHVHWRDMMARLRRYAKKHARRHMVLTDAHVPSGGIVHDGELMFDLHSFPSRPKAVKGKPHQAILEKGFSDSLYGRSKGGRTFSGWTCDALPYIVEIDNFGVSDHPGEYRASDKIHVWGWDEINWFMKQPEDDRNQWLRYAYKWVRETDPNGYFQLPLRRFQHYSASMNPPKGQRQEETIKAIWADRDKPTEQKIRVLSYNIHMWQIAVKDLAKIIRETDADVIGLNEAWTEKRNEEIARELKYQVVYGGQNPNDRPPRKPHTVNGYYMPQVLLTKHKIVESHCFNAMAAKDHPAFDPTVPIYRGGLLAVLETATGHRFVVFVLHLHPWGDGDNEKMTSMRLAELNGILQKLEAYRHLPIVILGDFNTRSHHDVKGGWKTTKKLSASGFSDLYRSLHLDVEKHPGLTCGEGRIDYIFHNKHFSPVESQVLTEGVLGSRGYKQSDHLPVFGVLKFKTEEKPTP